MRFGALLLAIGLAVGYGGYPTATSEPRIAPTKVLVFIEENHSLAQMQAQMPYTFDLAQQYGYATNYTAIRHPSLPNYLAITSGSTHGITNDKPPAINQFTGPSVFGQTITAGKTAKTYAETMPTNCRLTNSGNYAVRHNPWAYHQDERARCNQSDVPFTKFAADVTAGLPNLGFVIPNNCNNAHNCPLSTADAWFHQRMTTVFAGPDWQAGRLVVILTADEDDRHSGNKVLTVVIHPSQDGNVVTTPLNHYSLCRYLEDISGVSYLGAAEGATDMGAAFGIP